MIIISSLCLLLCLCVGYAAFNTQISLKAKGNIKESKNCEFGGLKVKTVTEGDGLYFDTYEEGKCTYKGTNPNNYIMFNNELWRIISTEEDGTIKIIRNGSNDVLRSQVYDTTNNSDWMRPATINTYLNTEYLSTIDINKDKIVMHDYGVGTIEDINIDLTKQIIDEKSKIWNGKIALLSVSEYIRANSNIDLCESFYLNNTNYDICKDTNWIYNLSSLDNDFIRTLTPIPEVELNGFLISEYEDYRMWVYDVAHEGFFSGKIAMSYFDFDSFGATINLYAYPVNESGVSIIPVLYLTPNITLSGTGTEQDPYTIVD